MTVVVLSIGILGSSITADAAWKKGSKGWWNTNASEVGYSTGWDDIAGKTYYFDQNGWMKTGWQNIGGTWYYFGGTNDGSMKKNQWIKSGNKWYYLQADGKMAVSQFLNIGNKSYYVNGNGVMLTGWQRLDGSWYYFNGSGAMQKGWLKLGNKWYYLQADGRMVENQFFDVGNKTYFVNGSGAMLTGWQKLGNTWYYFNGSGAMQKGWLSLGGKWYYLQADGKMAADQLIQVGGKTYYVNGSGVMQTGWKRVDGSWYYFNGSGAMEVNKWISGKYYVGADGKMYENTWTPDGYYVGSNGAWIKNYTGPKPEAHTHSYSQQFINATCTAEGKVIYTCSCGDTYTETVPKLSHTPGNWTEEGGQRVQRCSVCGTVLQTEAITMPTLVYNQTLSKEVLSEINKFRVANGKSAFQDGTLTCTKISRLQAGSNAYHYQFNGNITNLASHSGKSIGYATTTSSEKIAAYETVNSWAESPLHRSNILDNDANYCGVAVYTYNDKAGHYWTSVVATFAKDDASLVNDNAYINQWLYNVKQDEWNIFLNCPVK